MCERTALYRHYDGDGYLLYVGISIHAWKRTQSHKSSSSWFDNVRRIEIEYFETRRQALDAETEIARAEKPPFNKWKVEPGHIAPGSNIGRPRIDRPNLSDVMAARGVVVLDTAAKGAWGLVAAILPDLFKTAETARGAAAAARDRFARNRAGFIGKFDIPAGYATCRVKLPGTRSGNVPLAIRARSEAEARDLLARVLPGAELLEFVLVVKVLL